MVDERFYKRRGPILLSKIAESIEAFPDGPVKKDLYIEGVKNLSEASQADISFCSGSKYLGDLKESSAGACVVSDSISLDAEKEIILLRSKNPYLSYKKLIDLFYSPAETYPESIEKSAFVDSSAKIGKGTYIGRNVVIGAGAEIGEDCVIEACSFIGAGVKLGDRVAVGHSVTVIYSIIGSDVKISAGARIGCDGFGFATDSEGIHRDIFHIGRVIIGSDVTVGANATIDRGSLSDTVIGDFCRIDNSVQIGHNVRIGKGTVAAAQVGVAGSSVIGSYCAFGGQAGIAGHLKVADGVKLAGQTGVITDAPEKGATLGGTPAVPIRDWHRQSLLLKKSIKKGKI